MKFSGLIIALYPSIIFFSSSFFTLSLTAGVDKPTNEKCNKKLHNSSVAYICTHECTFFVKRTRVHLSISASIFENP
ncbi:DUF1272 domain-containing protein [Priestia megaterium]|uniref:DUF1272 domain-containing protein n=1 Tax=Priestia megaterium TaxID=1404 RepID=UPI002E20C60D